MDKPLCLAALALCPFAASCQEQPTNPLPTPDPVDMAWLQQEITDRTGAPAEPDAIALVLEAMDQMHAAADEIRPQHEQAVFDEMPDLADLPEIPDFRWLLDEYSDLELADSLRAYAEGAFNAMTGARVWASLDRAAASDGLDVRQFESFTALSEFLRLTELRRLAGAAEVRVERAIAEGDVDTAVDGLGHMLAIARVASAGTTSIAYLIAAAGQHQAEERIRAHLSELRADRAHLARLAALLDSHDRIVPADLAVDLEVRYGVRGLDKMLTPVPLKRSDPDDTVRVMPSEDRPRFMLEDEDDMPVESIDLDDVLEAIERANRVFLHAIARPRHERAEQLQMLLDLEASIDETHWPATMWPGALVKLIETHDERITRTRALRTMLAVELFRHDHNRPPDSLEELVPAYLPQLPADPLGGGPLKYRLVKEGESFPGNPDYLLYSVGMDGEDNNGSVPAYDHDAFTDRERTRGCDYIVNLPPDRD